MGTSHRNLIRYANVGADRQLHMDSMPYAGRSETFPHDPKAAITDSAAGGTAIATGVKTYNGAIGVDVDGNPVQSVLELAAKHGKATGLVTTSQVTDATPAVTTTTPSSCTSRFGISRLAGSRRSSRSSPRSPRSAWRSA